MNRPLPEPAADVLEDLAALERAFAGSRVAAIARRAADELGALRRRMAEGPAAPGDGSAPRLGAAWRDRGPR